MLHKEDDLVLQSKPEADQAQEKELEDHLTLHKEDDLVLQSKPEADQAQEKECQNI